MAWYTGKDKIRVIAVGDSNIMSAPFTSLAGVVPYNSENRFWANDDDTPYVQSGHTWRDLDPNDASRLLTQAASAAGDVAVEGSATLYANQLLGNNGSSTMSMANAFQQETGIPVYTYLAGVSGATTYDYINWAWTQLESSLTAAWAAIPGSPAPADIIYLSLGAGDLLWGDTDWQDLFPTSWRLPYTDVTAQQYYENVREFRSRMIAGGWWLPGTTQIVIQEIPRSGGYLSAYPAWQGLVTLLARLNDRVAMVSSLNRTYDPPLPIHYSPQSYADMGHDAYELVLAQIPKQQSVFSLGGNRLSIGGQKLRVHSA